MSTRRPQFNEQFHYDTTPLPDSIPKVQEVGASSAPLLSASFFIGARCRDYNDDYMKCKTDANGRGEFDCMKEGRRVTRCAQSVITDLNAQCLESFRAHWNCLDNNNHRIHRCRPEEWKLNKCVFEKLNLEKVIPEQRANSTPVELRQQQIFADHRINPLSSKPWSPPSKEAEKQA